MKKRFTFLLLILSIFLIGCNTTNDSKYNLEVDDPYNYIMGNLERKYYAGEEITIKSSIIFDVDLYLYINDKFVCSQTAIEENGHYTHWEFYFTMPAHNAKISLKTANEIEINPNEEIIYFDNEISEVEYSIKFDYQENEGTYKLHEAFVENGGLKDLEYQNIFYFKNSVYIFVYISKENYTDKVQEFMDELKQENNSIISIEKIIHYRYNTVYIHNPLFYQLEDNHKLPFEFAKPSILSKGIYKSIDDIQNEIDEFFVLNSDRSYIMEKKSEITKSLKSLYNEEYFKNNILIVTDTITTGSGSNRQELKSIYLKDNTLYIFVKMYFPGLGTCDMQSTRFAISIDKSCLNNLENLKQILLYKNPRYDGHGLW